MPSGYIISQQQRFILYSSSGRLGQKVFNESISQSSPAISYGQLIWANSNSEIWNRDLLNPNSIAHRVSDPTMRASSPAIYNHWAAWRGNVSSPGYAKWSIHSTDLNDSSIPPVEISTLIYNTPNTNSEILAQFGGFFPSIYQSKVVWGQPSSRELG